MATFAAVFSSAAAVRLREGVGWQIDALPNSTGEGVTVRLASAYFDLGMAAKLPGRLIADVRGTAASLEGAATVFGQVLALVSPVISVSANASAPEFEIDLVYDCTPDLEEHSFSQWRRQYEDPLVHPRHQLLDPDLAEVVLKRLIASSEASRAYRASVQYQEAVGSWRRGEELRAVMHLWMAAEALTKAFLRNECARSGTDDDGLCQAWHIEKRHLDREVRRRLIFHGDDDIYAQARDTSDALEHMFEDFPELQMKAAACRDATATHIRRAIVELIGVPAEMVASMTAGPYSAPVQLEALDRSIAGTLIGPADQLASTASKHPRLTDWTVELVAIESKGDGYELTASDKAKVSIGPAAQFKASGFGSNIPISEFTVEVLKAVISGNPTPPPEAAEGS